MLGISGLRFVSLQKGGRAREIAELGLQPLLADCDELMGDFADTARLVSALDLVITVDTAVAHLAGAMGRPVWVLLPQVPDWRWMVADNRSPWYPTMRLYRKEQAGRWDAVINRIAGDLANPINQ